MKRFNLFAVFAVVMIAIASLLKEVGLAAAWQIKQFHDKHYAFGVIPDLTQLQQYNVNRPDQVEAVRSSLYDTLAYAQAGQTQLSFFQLPKGQAGKTLADTNMTNAGSLPSPQSFLIETIELYFYPNGAPGSFGAQVAPNFLNDVYTFYKKGGWLELFIGSKAYLDEAPLQKFPPRCGLSGFAAASDNTTTGAAMQTLVDYASAGGPIYELDPPILLVPTQNFIVTLNWPALVPLVAAGTVVCQLGGVLYRNSQ